MAQYLILENPVVGIDKRGVRLIFEVALQDEKGTFLKLKDCRIAGGSVHPPSAPVNNRWTDRVEWSNDFKLLILKAIDDQGWRARFPQVRWPAAGGVA